MCVADRPVLAAVGQTVPGPGAAPRADVSGGVGGQGGWRDGLRLGHVIPVSDYRRYSVQTLRAAVQRVLQGESVRSVSIDLRLPRETLRRHAEKARWATPLQSGTGGVEITNYPPAGIQQSRTADAEVKIYPLTGMPQSRTADAEVKNYPPGGMPQSRTGDAEVKNYPPTGMPQSRTGDAEVKNYSPGGMPQSRTADAEVKNYPPAGMPPSRTADAELVKNYPPAGMPQ